MCFKMGKGNSKISSKLVSSVGGDGIECNYICGIEEITCGSFMLNMELKVPKFGRLKN